MTNAQKIVVGAGCIALLIGVGFALVGFNGGHRDEQLAAVWLIFLGCFLVVFGRFVGRP